LSRIRIDRVDVLGADQCVIQNVAAGARNDQKFVIRPELQGYAVDGRIFPAGVVDQ
jgi:hypothetical protein